MKRIFRKELKKRVLEDSVEIRKREIFCVTNGEVERHEVLKCKIGMLLKFKIGMLPGVRIQHVQKVSNIVQKLKKFVLLERQLTVD